MGYAAGRIFFVLSLESKIDQNYVGMGLFDQNLNLLESTLGFRELFVSEEEQ